MDNMTPITKRLMEAKEAAAKALADAGDALERRKAAGAKKLEMGTSPWPAKKDGGAGAPAARAPAPLG